MNKSVIESIRGELKSHVDPVYRDGARRFFKEEIKILGVRAPIVRKIAAAWFVGFRTKTQNNEILSLCNQLLASGVQGEQIVALAWAGRLIKRCEPQDFKTFERWAKRYLTNWASCDDYCSHVLGPFLLRFPAYAPRMKTWAHSKNLWVRRMSAVGLIVPLRKGQQLPLAFQIADILLQDREDLVQKGYGWMLKEASKQFPKEILAYVMARRSRMPRTALRYAIEHYPPPIRRGVLHTPSA